MASRSSVPVCSATFIWVEVLEENQAKLVPNKHLGT